MVFNASIFFLVGLCLVWALWLCASSWKCRNMSYALWSVRRHVVLGLSLLVVAVILCLSYDIMYQDLGRELGATNLNDYFVLLAWISSFVSLPLIAMGFIAAREAKSSQIR